MLYRCCYLLLFIVILPNNILAKIKIDNFYHRDFVNQKKSNTLFLDARSPQEYQNETLLLYNQKKLLYPQIYDLLPTLKQEQLSQALRVQNSNSEERLISLEKRIFQHIATNLSNQIEAIKTSKNKKYIMAPHNDVAISVNQKKIDIFINFYTHKKRKIFLTGLKRAPKYYKMVDRIFKEYGLPHDLFYLAMVESNFNQKAISKASAVGLWQFMAKTGKSYGMTYSWWHDDRLDAEKLTHTAAKFLKTLYTKYKDWSLVLAAYNSGIGTVNRAIAKNKKLGKPTDYWSLKLPKETENYVPVFLAVIHIFNNLEYYNFPIPQKLEEWKKYKIVHVSPSVSFAQISKKTALNVVELQNFNPSLKYSITPYSKSKYPLKVPIYSQINKQQLASLTPDIAQGFITHRITRGDNLWNISRKYQTSLKNIYLSNPVLNANKYLRPGQKIIIPIATSSPKKLQITTDNKVYVVRKGDSLWSIAKKYRVSIKHLIKKNYHLSSTKDIIRIGVKIKI